MHSSIRTNRAIALALACVGLALGPSCQKAEPVKIGFVATLTGRDAELGTDCRDGALLAVEDANGKGGVDGRPVELLIRDDKQDPSKAVEADQELARIGCQVIVGHMTSNMCEAAMPWLSTSGIAMISPTATSEEFSGRKDHFYRTYTSTESLASVQASYAAQKLNCKTAALVFDDRNRAHTQFWADTFKRHFKKSDGRVAGEVKFNSKEPVDFRRIARQVRGFDPDIVLVLANALDAAMVCQHLRTVGVKGRLAGSEWAVTKELRRLGGKSIHGFLIACNYPYGCQKSACLSFMERFRSRFGRDPTGLSWHGYNATSVAVQAMRLAIRNKQDVNKVLQQPRRYKGATSEIALDAYGDAHLPVVIAEVDGDGLRTVFSD